MGYSKSFQRALLSDAEAIDRIREHAPPALRTLGATLQSFERDTATATMAFEAALDLCHSGDIVQGGFVAGMLDAAMAHAVFLLVREDVILPTLELKVSYLDIARAGSLRADGSVLRLGKSTVFLEGRLYDNNDKLLATASSTARLLRPTSA